jgi:succinate--hydroxymethylglutarate CoA-transferase
MITVGSIFGPKPFAADFENIVLARGMVKEVDHPTCGPIKLINTPVKYSYSTPGIRTPPPTLGQHTDEILRDSLGISDEEIKNLRIDGVVG